MSSYFEGNYSWSNLETSPWIRSFSEPGEKNMQSTCRHENLKTCSNIPLEETHHPQGSQTYSNVSASPNTAPEAERADHTAPSLFTLHR